MPLEIRKQNRETSQGLVRRFGLRMQKSGLLMRARRNRFKKREKSDGTKKREALKREDLKKEYIRQEKLGKLPKTKRRR